MTKTVDETVNERGARYGKFSDGAYIMQDLKGIMRNSKGWNNLLIAKKKGLK